MSETKHTPLPLSIRRDKWYMVIDDAEGNPYVFIQDGDRPTFDHERIAEEICTSVNAHERLEADSKKLREPATCNAGHKSNLPVALLDCPVCTQLLRDKLQKVEELVSAAAEALTFVKGMENDAREDHYFKLAENAGASASRLEQAIRALESCLESGRQAALGGKEE